MRGSVAVLVFMLLALGAASRTSADDNSQSRATLKDLRGAYVVAVTDFTSQEERAGWDRGQIQAEAELQVRTAGMRVLSRDEWLATPGQPVLAITVSPLHAFKGGPAPFVIKVELLQEVRLARRGDQGVVPGVTWSVGFLGVGDPPIARERAMLMEQQFLTAWRSVNPKR